MGNKYNFEEIAKSFELLYDNMMDYVYIYDLSRDILQISEKAVERFQIDSSRTKFMTILDKLIYKDDLEMLKEDISKLVLGEKTRHDLRYRWMNKENDPVWIDCRGSVCYDESGENLLLIGCVSEIGNTPFADNITGLLNFNSERDKIEKNIFNDKMFAILFGVDNLASINKHFGFEYADEKLREISTIISQMTKQNQMVVKLYSDQFLLIDYKSSSLKDAKRIYDDVRNKIRNITKDESFMTVSAGIINSDFKFDSMEDFLNKLACSLNEAKFKGKDQAVFYRDSLYEKQFMQEKLLLEIKNSLNHDFLGFDVYFQPIVNPFTNNVKGFEALLRFEANGIKYSPSDFIPILEETKLILTVGEYLFKRCINFSNLINKDREEKLLISVNLSYIQIVRSSSFKKLTSMPNFDPSLFTFEITENGNVANNKFIIDQVERIRSLGFYIAIDDFGTGYSNFYNIISIKPNCLKIDRLFVIDILTNKINRDVLKTLIDIAHSMNSIVIVEGVEREDELELIKTLNPDFIQGFYYSKPLCEKEIIEKYNLLNN